MSKDIFNEAVLRVAHVENLSIDFILDTMSVSEIVNRCKEYNRAIEHNMDSIRESWYF